MKKIISLLLLLASCSLYKPVQEFNSIAEIMTWIYDNIEYKTDDLQYWQTAKETQELMTGDCEDIAVLMIAMCYNHVGLKYNLGCYFREFGGEIIGHAIVIGDQLYDPTHNEIFNPDNWDLEYIITFDDLLLWGYL